MADETEYKDLLIKQYWNKPKATAEIGVLADNLLRSADLVRQFENELDLDQATGHRLDLIGGIVGYSRTRDEEIPLSLQGATSSQLSDTAYRQMLKVAIARNVAVAVMASNTRLSLQDVIMRAFDGEVYALDNYNMTLSLIAPITFDPVLLAFVRDSGLLPKPVTVRYSPIILAEVGVSFGFAENPEALGWDDKFEVVANPGTFAEKVL